MTDIYKNGVIGDSNRSNPVMLPRRKPC